MASVPSGEWVPHVEAYVDVSRPAAQHVRSSFLFSPLPLLCTIGFSVLAALVQLAYVLRNSAVSASVDALATLVNKDRLTLFDLVAKMDMYLTTTDHILRSRGILLLGELLSRISDKWLDVNTITTLSDFFISRLSDWPAIRGALVGCLALLHRKQGGGCIVIADVKRLVESFLQNVQVQSLAAADRKGGEQLYWICEAIDEEKDPECLKLSFHVVEVVMKLFPDPSGLAAQFASEFFEILSKYFPVYFTHGVADDLNATRDDLSKALMHAFCSTPYFEPFAIPLLLDKLSSSLPLAKASNLTYCMLLQQFTIVNYAQNFYYSLSSEQLLLTSGSPKDAEKNKNQMVSEALNCLKTAIVFIDSSDKDLFINLILFDGDIENKIHSILSAERSILSSVEDLAQVNALGSVISILAESSTYSCTRVFQEHFTHLVDALGTSTDYESRQLNTSNGSSSTSVNYGALYLSVQMLSSCREVALASYADFSSIKLTKVSWWLILEKKLDRLIHLLGSLLTIDSQSMHSVLRGEYVSCAVKGLLTLATFPEQCSPLPANAYEDILSMLTSVITSKFENIDLWRLSLKALTSIGSSIVKFNASQKEVIYCRTVVDNVVSLVESYDGSMPLSLRLEASYEVGTAGLNYMLRVAKSLEGAVVTNISKNQFTEFSHENQLDKILDDILERCFSTVLANSYSKIPHSSIGTSNYSNLSDKSSGNILSKIDILSGLAWIGKGLLMRGDEKVKDISMFLLKCVCSDEALASEESYGNDSSDTSVAKSAAGAFHIMMSDSEVCLNKKFHARIKPLYKQRFFLILTPIFLSKIKKATSMTTKLALYRAFGHIISNAPVPAVISEAHQILLVIVDSLAKLSVSMQDKDLVYNLLLVLSGMLMDEKGEIIILLLSLHS
ncbi:hypothetical protein HU200_028262 [Digitaria exilis]|uniref:MMS19 nucleotide excision repair protein n=1 Tax=Digitaria exilis TaxID=1010633 RepID=A0A835C426_9POAL|nr:hypothetical protein HU200_028262 [Digitaria exilis]